MRYAGRADASVGGRVWGRLLELEFIDRSVALAAKAFVSFFPLLIAFASVLPVQGRDEMLRVIATRLGVSGAAFDVVRQAFASPDVTRTATGFVGVVVGVAYAVSFTTALQRVYLRSWRRPPGGGLRNRGRGLLWLTTVLGLLTFLSLLRSVAGEVGSWGPRATGQHGAVVVDRAHPVAR
jgi:membrane protein